MTKERPTELNKRLKRVTTSRDNLKEHNRKKALENKKLRDRNVEIRQGRDFWKNKHDEQKRIQKAGLFD